MATYQVFAGEIVINSTNKTIDFEENSGASSWTATLTEGSYCLYGDATETGLISAGDSNGDILAEIKTQMEAVGANTYTPAWSGDITDGNTTGSVNITSTATNFQILNTGTFDLSILGIPSTGMPSATTDYTSTLSPSYTWLSNQPCEIGIDKAGPFSRDVTQVIAPDGTIFSFSMSSTHKMRQYILSNVTGDRVLTDLSSSDTARAFENFWGLVNTGRQVRVYQASDSSGTIASLSSANLEDSYVMAEGSLRSFAPQRVAPGLSLFSWPINLREYV